MSSTDFFYRNPTFKLKAEEILKANNLKLLQAFIGVRNSIAFLQYNASFYITKMNMRQAYFQATISAPMKVRKYLCEEIEKSGKLPLNADAEVKNIISSAKESLKSDKLTLPKTKCEHKFLLDSKPKDVKVYVEETNIGSLCTMSKDLAANVYENIVEKTKVKDAVKIDLRNKDPQYIKEKLEEEICNLNIQAEVFSAEFEEYNQKLQNIKDGTFLSEWNTKLMNSIVEEALANKSHLLHFYVTECHKVSTGVKFIGNCVAKKLRKAWNCELLTRVIKRIKFNAYEEVMEKLRYMDMESDNFVKHLLEAFVKMKTETLTENIKHVVDGFTPLLLASEEQNILDCLLRTAMQYKNEDNVLFLLFNGANPKAVENLCTVVGEEKLAIIEIKRLYEHMPPIELPRLSFEQMKDIFPAEDEMYKIADLIIKQNECLSNQKKQLEDVLNTEYSWYLYFLYIKNIPTKINLSRVNTAETVIEKLKKSFENDVAVASHEPLSKEIKGIKKEEGWFSLNAEVFKEIEELAAKTVNVNKAVSVIELAEGIVACKTGYINDKKEEEMIHTVSNNSEKYVEELKRKVESSSQEKINLTKLQANAKAEERIVEEEENKAHDEVVKAMCEKEKAEDEEQRAKEEAEEIIRIAKSKVIATTMLHNEAENQRIDVSSIDDVVKEFLLEVFTIRVLYDRFTSEFFDLFSIFQSFVGCLNLDNSFLNEIINLEDKFKYLSKQFAKCKTAESALIIPVCNEVSHYMFMAIALKKMKETRNAAQEAKDEVEAKKVAIKTEVQSIASLL